MRTIQIGGDLGAGSLGSPATEPLAEETLNLLYSRPGSSVVPQRGHRPHPHRKHLERALSSRLVKSANLRRGTSLNKSSPRNHFNPLNRLVVLIVRAFLAVGV